MSLIRVLLCMASLGSIAATAICPANAADKRLAALTADDFRRIDSYIESQLAAANIPGAALVIVEGDQITHVRGYGIAGPDGRPATAETGFYLGSVTKSFSALAVMQLVEAGQIELDAPVQKYLPWFRVADAGASEQMKVKHLLNHTSGFSTYTGRTHLAASDVSPEAIERRVRDLRKARLTAPVGEGRQYSNANYCVLGAIIESVSGQSYEDYVTEHIFEPLTMTKSFAPNDTAAQDDLATGFRYWFGQPVSAADVPRSRGYLPSMFLISCARDMGNYLLAHMNGGVLGDTRVLSDSGISRLHTPERQDLNYAMGWVTRSVGDVKTLSHTGTTPTFHAEVTIFPEHQRGFALLINAQNQLSGPDVASLARMVELNMIGMMALPIAKAPTFPWSLALLSALLIGQVIGLGVTARQAYRSHKLSHDDPGTSCRIKPARFGLLLAIDVTVVAGTIWWIPQSYEAPFSGVLLYAPDAGWLLLANATLAATSIVAAICTVVWPISVSFRAP